ncbi:MAG TPA: MerR family transcriptional regulator [Acidobacteriaceae bacterium]|jgi:DNA-binding transcriptional MerR regulator|nr:MerR family transcriptional regulator [Acidobacteriaceae bacterium]
MDDDPMAMQQPTRRDTHKAEPRVSIPDKLYFRIGEVSHLSGLPAYVLRFWESEFPQLKPNKGGTGQRLYRKRDVELVLEIKRLLYDQKFTIPGARRILVDKRRGGDPQSELPFRNSQQKPMATRIAQLRGELREILGILDGTLPKHRRMLSSAKRAARSPKIVAEVNTPQLF